MRDDVGGRLAAHARRGRASPPARHRGRRGPRGRRRARRAPARRRSGSRTAARAPTRPRAGADATRVLGACAPAPPRAARRRPAGVPDTSSEPRVERSAQRQAPGVGVERLDRAAQHDFGQRIEVELGGKRVAQAPDGRSAGGCARARRAPGAAGPARCARCGRAREAAAPPISGRIRSTCAGS